MTKELNEKLFEVADLGNAEAVKQLIERGNRWTPLHYAAYRGHIHRVKQLIEQGADVNAKGAAAMTPLHYAAYFGHTDTVKQLIEQGADVNAKDGAGQTPLNRAARRSHTEIVTLLDDAARKQPGFAAREQDRRDGPSNEGRG